MSEKQAKIIYLSVGSNLGNRKKNIEKTKFELYSKGINIIRSSNYYETLSWPNPKNPKFYNVILKASSDLKILELLKICKQIEKSLGRKAKVKFLPLQPGDVPDTFANVKNLKNTFKYKPSTTVINGISKFVKW